MASEHCISLERVSRWYGQVIGLNDVSCTIGPGITALLGPNGAGKSTFMKLVSGQLRPTTGQVRVFDHDPFANGEVFRRLGYCPEIDQFYEEMTGREFVRMLATLSGYRGSELTSRVEEAIKLVGMEPNASRRIAGYSKGMRQRIKLAQALVHNPDILLLDEPLNGLDPMGRREVADLLRRLEQAGKCVVISSHILYEVEQLTQQMLLVHRGRLLAQGNLYQIRSLIDTRPHRIDLECETPRLLARELTSIEGVVSIRLDQTRPHWLEIETSSPDQFYTALPELVLDRGVDIRAVESADNNLEAVFRYLTEAA